MKNSKKTSGILGTSLGSMLIIVALLTMVGMGSSDTYAGTSLTGEKCTCPDGYTPSGAKCTKTTTTTYTCYTGETSLSPTCSSTSGCTMTGKSGLSAVSVWYKYSCPKVTTESKACECSGGGTANSSGMCEEKEPSTKNCLSTQYKSGDNCLPCPSGATCDGTSYTCKSGFVDNGSSCEAQITTGECDTVGGTCKIGGKTGTCTLTGGKKLCKVNSSSGGDDGNSSCSKADDTCTSNGKNGKCVASGSGFTCQITTSPSGGDDDSGKNIGNCPAGTYYLGLNHAADCPSGYYCPGGTYNANTGDIISGCEKIACPANATCTSSSYTCNKGYHPSSGGCVKDGTSGGNDGSGGNGGGNGGGNSGGNTGGNGNNGNNGGNSGGNNGNNNGSNNVNRNPSTATKAPLVIAIIGIMSVGISTVVYFKGKKEINTEI